MRFLSPNSSKDHYTIFTGSDKPADRPAGQTKRRWLKLETTIPYTTPFMVFGEYLLQLVQFPPRYCTINKLS